MNNLLKSNNFLKLIDSMIPCDDSHNLAPSSIIFMLKSERLISDWDKFAIDFSDVLALLDLLNSFSGFHDFRMSLNDKLPREHIEKFFLHLSRLLLYSYFSAPIVLTELCLLPSEHSMLEFFKFAEYHDICDS